MSRTLSRQRTEILIHHRTGASNGPTEGTIIWSAKQVERVSVYRSEFTNFGHYTGFASPPRRRRHVARPICPPRITSTRPH